MEEVTQELFYALVDNWQDETSFHSNPSLVIGNKYFLHIIGLGKEGLPFILKDLGEDRVDDWKTVFWFTALNAITRIYPYPTFLGNDEELVRDSWLKWGRQNKFIQ